MHGNGPMDSTQAPILVKAIAGGVHLTLTAPFNVNTDDLESALSRVLAKKPKLVEFDIAAVDHLSTVGIGVLVELNNNVTAYGGKLLITALREHTQSVLHTTRLDTVIKIAPNALID